MARATGAPPDAVFGEAAASLARFSGDPVSMVTACRRLVDRHATLGPIWWLTSRVLTAPDPGDEAWRCLDDFTVDPTADELAHALPEDASVILVGATPAVVRALGRRGDIRVGVVDLWDGPSAAVAALERLEVNSFGLGPTGLGAVAEAQVVVLCPSVIGPQAMVAGAGSRAVAALARTAGVPVWTVAGAGRVLPAPLWEALMVRARRSGLLVEGFHPDPDADQEKVPLELVDHLVGPQGPEPVEVGLKRGDIPVPMELVGGVGPR